jgi:hypothetical protein
MIRLQDARAGAGTARERHGLVRYGSASQQDPSR